MLKKLISKAGYKKLSASDKKRVSTAAKKSTSKKRTKKSWF